MDSFRSGSWWPNSVRYLFNLKVLQWPPLRRRPRHVLLSSVISTRRARWLACASVLRAAKQPCPYSAIILASNPSVKMPLPFPSRSARQGWCTTPSILMFCDWGGFGRTFSHINIDGVAIHWSRGPCLRIYKRSGWWGAGVYAKEANAGFGRHL